MRTARAYVPGHVTGLFRIYDTHPDPLHRGSRGAGFSITAGTLTTVTVTDEQNSVITTTYNGEIIEAVVTETVVAKLSEAYNMTLSVEVTHQSDLPIGVGFGASGAGALGTALSLATIVDPNLDYTSAAQYAHHAEVVNHAGLGDVIAQTVGGLEVRTKAGAPGLGEVIRISHPDDLIVVLAGSTGLNTKDVLTDPKWREAINLAGEDLLDDLAKQLSFEHICEVSKLFAATIDLETPRIIPALATLHKNNLALSSQVMLGDSVFCICKQSNVEHAKSILREYWDEDEIMETTISSAGGQVLQ
ncbi:MAG: pantoate kinase [Candidatus Thorarchaeota archaeon]|nr:pantoate kinase [Candidatus Thorarchaeota archaeon]